MAKKYKILNKQPVIAPKANYLLANKFHPDRWLTADKILHALRFSRQGKFQHILPKLIGRDEMKQGITRLFLHAQANYERGEA